MLIMFRAKNFTSFHEEVILDMRATSYKEHMSHTIPFGDFRLLKTVAIYGANASGKSNLISALYCFEQFIFNQLFKEKVEDDQVDESDEKSNTISIEPFLLAEPIDKCIEFEMIFGHNDILYQYGFSFEDSNIITEWLNIDNEVVFDRDMNSGIKYGNKYKELLKDYKKYREDRLYLSVLDYFATGKIKDQIDNFKSFFQKRFNLYFELFFESTIKGTMSAVGLSKRLVENEDFRRRVAKYISIIDVGIMDLVIEKEVKVRRRTGEKREMPVIKTLHAVYTSDGIKNGTKAFDLHQESTGTLRFLSFIQNILLLLENGGVFMIDELSARLHPLLTKFIIDIFQSEINDKNAQLIFTTHDTSILNKEQFRRDEVVFIDKNERGESSLYSLADLKTVRQDATYNKDYFNGKYGAIPIFKSTRVMNGGE
jgi:uncharacterized protein